MIERPESGDATPAQRALIARLAHQHPAWSEKLNGLEWERCFDVLGGDKFVSAAEASLVISALLGVIGEDADRGRA